MEHCGSGVTNKAGTPLDQARVSDNLRYHRTTRQTQRQRGPGHQQGDRGSNPIMPSKSKSVNWDAVTLWIVIAAIVIAVAVVIALSRMN